MKGLEVVASRAFYRPAGFMTLQQAGELVAQALKHARELGLTDILVNTSQLGGFDPPCTIERYALIARWVESAGTGLGVAIVTRPNFVDPQKIGVLMAQNRGASLDSFVDEASALKWLDSRRARSSSRTSVRSRASGY